MGLIASYAHHDDKAKSLGGGRRSGDGNNQQLRFGIAVGLRDDGSVRDPLFTATA